MARLVARVITLDQAVTAGCAFFLRHGTIDMDALAIKMAVSRATLYRVVGSRDRLLGEVLCQLVSRSIAKARARRTQDGVDGVLEVVQDVSASILASRTLRQFVAAEPEAASRLLGGASVGGVHTRAVLAAERLLTEVGLRVELGVRGDALGEVETVADLVVRIVESLCFGAGTIPARSRLDLTVASIRGLLVEACQPTARPSRVPRMRRLLDAAMCVMWAPVPGFLTDLPGSLQGAGM